QRDHQVDLVVAGGRDHHVAVLQAGLLQAGHLAGVGQHPFGLRHDVPLEVALVPFEQHHLVAVLHQLGGDRPADRAGAGDGDPHQWLPSGGAAARPRTRSAVWSVIATEIWSPCWTTVAGSGSRASPNRVMNTTRAPVTASSSVILCPIQFSCTSSWASTT